MTSVVVNECGRFFVVVSMTYVKKSISSLASSGISSGIFAEASRRCLIHDLHKVVEFRFLAVPR
jgi:hypothetical protein